MKDWTGLALRFVLPNGWAVICLEDLPFTAEMMRQMMWFPSAWFFISGTYPEPWKGENSPPGEQFAPVDTSHVLVKTTN